MCIRDSPEGYTATDIMSRMKRMQGYNVLHPMGYDSFGLPAEQYACPVSYTHLAGEAVAKEKGFNYNSVSSQADALMAVSYTHLDVYKRQI